jgi:hypothetical protein
MHAALSLNEIACGIVHHLDAQWDRETLLALVVTNRLLCDAALGVLWAEPPVWDLAQRMDPSLWVIEEAGDSVEYRQGDLVSTEDFETSTRSEVVSIV